MNRLRLRLEKINQQMIDMEPMYIEFFDQLFIHEIDPPLLQKEKIITFAELINGLEKITTPENVYTSELYRKTENGEVKPYSLTSEDKLIMFNHYFKPHPTDTKEDVKEREEKKTRFLAKFPEYFDEH